MEESPPLRKRSTLFKLQGRSESSGEGGEVDAPVSPAVDGAARMGAQSPYDRPTSAGITDEAPTPPPCAPYA